VAVPVAVDSAVALVAAVSAAALVVDSAVVHMVALAVVIWDHHLQEEVGDGEEVILMAVDLAAWVVLCLFFWQQQD
jgi:hypothetical protein